jgi:hypothetical protein
LHYFKIADVVLGINAPGWVLKGNLTSFSHVSSDVDIVCNIEFQRIEPDIDRARIIIDVPRAMYFSLDGYIYIMYKAGMRAPALIAIKDDFSICTMYIDPVYNKPNDTTNILKVTGGIFDDLLVVLIPVLAKKSALMIHSSSVIWENKGIIFSAPSGAGKTTHTNFWKQLYGARILDGDITAVKVENGTAIAYGLPWCGTSNEFLNERVCLDSIVFLEQVKENHIYKLSYEEAVMRILSRAFLLPLNNDMMDMYIDIVKKIAKATDCYVLECLPDKSSAELVKRCLEEKSLN